MKQMNKTFTALSIFILTTLLIYVIGCNEIPSSQPTLNNDNQEAYDPLDYAAVGYPALDADTLIFKNEKQFEKFLDYYDLADYVVLAPTFDKTIDVEDALPYKWMTNAAGHTVWCIDPSYYTIPYPENQAYIHDEAFAGKRAVIIFDHSGLAKSDREFRPEYCPDVEYRNCDLWITSPWTGQVAIFKDVIYWSDKNGNGVFNTNLHAWLLWGKDRPEMTYSFVINLWDVETGCDLSYRAYVPGHETAELRFGSMNLYYGYLRP